MRLSPQLLFRLTNPSRFRVTRRSCEIGREHGCYGDTRRYVMREGYEDGGHYRYTNNMAHGPEGMWALIVLYTGIGWLSGIVSDKPNSLELRGCDPVPPNEYWDYPGGHFREVESD